MGVLLQVDGISKSIGDLQLFSDITFVVNTGEKVAIIAKNGVGKTTLMNIIAGADSADSGTIFLDRQVKTAYLRQEPLLTAGKTVFEEVFHSSDEMIMVIREYEKALVSGEQKPLEAAIAKMDHYKAWDHEVRVKQILTRLKISDLDQKIEILSGGQKKRVALAQVLINKPEFLILDEPTNHLDVEMIEWLEEYLKKSGCTLLMVTHDRYFLDRICDEIIEMDNNRLYVYSGNYSDFLRKREERIANEQAVVSKARNLLRKETEWMRRMPQARATKAKSRIEAFYELKEVASGKKEAKNMKINIAATRMGKKILEAHGLSFKWDNTYYIKDFSYNFARNEKIGIIGKNGAGKSTLLELLTGALKPEKGTLEHGETVVFGFVRQEGISFDESQKVIDVARSIAETVTLGNGNVVDVSQFLTQFMFPPSVQHNYISKLSGGEKRRLYLLTILMRRPNFLILDEPTNDIDIMSLAILEDYLQNFNGCVLIVSHDRFFMDQIVDHIFVFEGDAVIKDFPGNYSDYREYVEQKIKKEKASEKIQAAPEKAKPERAVKPKPTYKEKQEHERLIKEIEQLESEKKELEIQLSSGNLSHGELSEKSTRIGALIEEINAKTNRWIELEEKMEG
ncbi:MAG: ABC-F family ATP-binding cassette domain-containing protein [Bacteroidales bacterium]|nr:ABC-F family ATP-binding cassette domain-containing protein [Bacteroidales bacterium]